MVGTSLLEGVIKKVMERCMLDYFGASTHTLSVTQSEKSNQKNLLISTVDEMV